MRRSGASVCLLMGLAWCVQAAEIQGVVIDRSCADQVVKIGREKTLKERHECSLMHHYVRSGYGILTDDQHFFRFDDAGNKKVLELLRNTPDKDNLKIIVTGDVEGDTIKVSQMSML